MKKNIKYITILIQTILSFFIILFGFFALYEDPFLIGMELLLTVNMFIIAYNNHKQTYNSFFTIAYIVMGLMCLFIAILLVVR